MATRGADVKGIELEQGMHKGAWGDEVITIKRPDGLRFEVPCNNDTVATPIHIEAILQDIGEEDPEIREATQKYCLDRLEEDKENFENPEVDGVTIRRLETEVHAFMDGYRAALKQKN